MGLFRRGRAVGADGREGRSARVMVIIMIASIFTGDVAQLVIQMRSAILENGVGASARVGNYFFHEVFWDCEWCAYWRRNAQRAGANVPCENLLLMRGKRNRALRIGLRLYQERERCPGVENKLTLRMKALQYFQDE